MSSDLSVGRVQPSLDLSQSSTAQGRGKTAEGPPPANVSPPITQPQNVAASNRAEPTADPQKVLDDAARQAAQDLYKGRDVQVTGMMDDQSGRMIYRVTDRESGELLVQSPSDALLRFYASGRAEQEGNLIEIDA